MSRVSLAVAPDVVADHDGADSELRARACARQSRGASLRSGRRELRPYSRRSPQCPTIAGSSRASWRRCSVRTRVTFMRRSAGSGQQAPSSRPRASG